ncbi:hypothetical protein OROHE_021766 [Orobanche hederae]
MASVVKGAVNLIREKGIGGFFRELRAEGYLDKWILDNGDVIVGVNNYGEADIELSNDILMRDTIDPLAIIVERTYHSYSRICIIRYFFKIGLYLLKPNEIVEKINDYILSLLPGDVVDYMSSNSISKEDGDMDGLEYIFSVEFLNTVRCSGLPNQVFKLKVGCPVMLLRNIDQSAELCNCTRMIVTNLYKHVIDAAIAFGKNAGRKIFIPRIILVQISPNSLSRSNVGSSPVRLLCNDYKQELMTVSLAHCTLSS